MGKDPCYKVIDGIPTDTCYCEKLRSGPILQPASTLADFGFIIVGLAILAIVGNGNGRSSASNANPMTNGCWSAAVFGLVVILLGPGSMVFHASMTYWGGFLDSTSMYLLLAFLIAYDLRQMTGLPEWLVWLIGILALALFMTLAPIWREQATIFFVIMVGVTLCFEVPIWFGWGASVRRSIPWLLGFAATFFTALLI